MSYIGERVAYLQGLAEGLNINEGTSEGKLLLKMIEVLEDVAEAFSELEQEHDELDEYVANIDEDLSAVEEELFGTEDDEDYDEDDEDDDDDLLEIECPHCNQEVCFDKNELAQGELICPACKKPVFPDEPQDEE